MSARSDGMAGRLFGGNKGELHAVEAIGRKDGLSPETIKKVSEWAKKSILPLFDDYGVEVHPKAHILATAVHVAIEHAAGRVPDALVKQWDSLVMEKLVARRIPRGKAREIFLGIDARLLKERPAHLRAFREAYPITRHPVISRHLVNWELRRRGEDARSPAKYVHAARNESAVAGVRPGTQLLAGSGQVGATALRSLGRSPLGEDLDAA